MDAPEEEPAYEYLKAGHPPATKVSTGTIVLCSRKLCQKIFVYVPVGKYGFRFLSFLTSWNPESSFPDLGPGSDDFKLSYRALNFYSINTVIY
jgi:hypothetical protein